MKILVTGGAGFIGSHVVEAYLANGHEVTVVDDFSTGRHDNLPPQCSQITMDVRDPNISTLFEKSKFDVVNHHAAQKSVTASQQDPFFDASVNILGTLRLLDCVRTYHVKQFIFSASGGTYYGESEKPVTESTAGHPKSAYGLSKLTAEQYIQLYAKEFKFNYTIFRYANVYGPRQDPMGEAGVVAIFANNLIQKKPSIIYGSGDQTRDFVYVSDVARANLLALGSLENKIVNIGTGKKTSVNELYQKLCALTKSTPTPSYQPAREGELMHSCLDHSFAQKTLQWHPMVSLSEGLELTLKYFSEK